MHIHQHQHHRRNPIDDSQAFIDEHNPLHKRSVIYKTVYKTLEPTFSGSVAGYTTIGKDSDDATTTSEETTAAAATTTATTSDDDTTMPDSVTYAVTSGLPTTLATKIATDGSIAAESSTDSSLLATGTSASSTEESSSSDSGSGSSTATKAGIAIGVMAAVLLVFVCIWFLFKKRKGKEEEDHQHLKDNEKTDGAFSNRPASTYSARTTRTTATAPRLSLRPVTEFIPNLEKRDSKGAAAILGGQGAAHSAQNVQTAPAGPLRSPGQSLWERPMTSDSNHVENPFGNHAERVPTPANERNISAMAPISTGNVTPDSAQVSPPLQTNGVQQPPVPGSPPPIRASMPVGPGSPESAVVAVAGTSAVMVANGAAVASNLARKASMKKGSPKPLDLTIPSGIAMTSIPASPAGSEYSATSIPADRATGLTQGAAAIAAAGGPNNSTVHRVQLDFAPTLEDELELKSGQLVRLLHEYDDGWALCIRLDRSQQGVVPRTCLSARPVKPRPMLPPGQPRPMLPAGHPGSRPQSPAGHPGSRPQSPAGHPGSRPQSPAPRSMSPYRPQSPAGARPQNPAGRPQSPGPRSRSPSGTTRRNNPLGPSPMNPNAGSPPLPEQNFSPAPLQTPSSGSPIQAPSSRAPIQAQISGSPTQTPIPSSPPQEQRIERKPVPGQAY